MKETMQPEETVAIAKDGLPAYGVVSRYLDREGEKYFQVQETAGLLGADYNKFIFAPYVDQDDDVLEFGCGGGFLLHNLRARTKTGIEINPAARAHAAKLGLDVYGTLDEVRERKFSRIITSHALEHVPGPLEALIEMRQLLTPDGLLVWLSPMDDWRNANQRVWSPDDHDMHLYTWTPLLIGNLLTAGGFRPRSISVLTHAFPPTSLAKLLWQTNARLFYLAARIWSIVRRQRQIVAVASPDQNPSVAT
jgi:SAM-dependent methyltransferase